MSKQNTLRNKAIVVLRRSDKKEFSFAKIGELFEISRTCVKVIWDRDKDKYVTEGSK